MAFTPNLARYFERIGLHAAVAPTLADLNAIVYAHIRHIPFENVDVLLGVPIELDPAKIEQKLVDQRRGGYCFEQNTLLMHVLAALGFRVTPLGARVRIGRSRAETPPRTHMFLRVDLPEGPWLVDVGVGGLSPTAALRLELDVIQPTPHEARRLSSEGEWQGLGLRAPDAKLYHQAYFDGAWHDVYEFTLEAMPEIDRTLANFFTSAHPSSHFKSRLLAALATERGRKTLLDRRFTVRDGEGGSVVREIESPEALLDVLEQQFGIGLPCGTRVACAGLDWAGAG